MGRTPAIFIGFTSSPIGEIEDIIPEPTPPSNMSVKETIDKWYENKFPALRGTQLAQAGMQGLTGFPTSIYATDDTGEVFSDMGISSDAPLSVKFFQWLSSRGYEQHNVRLVGFDVADFAWICGIDALLNGEAVAPEFWSQSSREYIPVSLRVDPYHAVTTSDQRKYMTLPMLLGLSGLYFPEGWSTHTDAMRDAQIAYAMARQFHLVEMAGHLKFPLGTNHPQPALAV